ncbi:MAG: hypothetical protein ACREDR_41435, partial [Blastocatellia bacterium]
MGSIPTIPTNQIASHRILSPASPMKTADVDFDTIPGSTVHKTALTICLKCAFDFFTKQLGLSPRTAYSELKKHVPEEADFSGAATARPHFFETEGLGHCPYCNGSKRGFARFYSFRVDAHPSFEKARKKLWSALKKQPERFTLFSPDRTQMQIFSEWLERLKSRTNVEADDWLLSIAFEQLRRAYPAEDWNEILKTVTRIQVSHRMENDWKPDGTVIYVSAALYGDMLLVQHLLSRSQHHGGHTFEGRLTLPELITRLRRLGYLEANQIETRDPQQAFEEAVSKVVASGPSAVY